MLEVEIHPKVFLDGLFRCLPTKSWQSSKSKWLQKGKKKLQCSSLCFGVFTGWHKQPPKVLSVVPFTGLAVQMCSEVSDDGKQLQWSTFSQRWSCTDYWRWDSTNTKSKRKLKKDWRNTRGRWIMWVSREWRLNFTPATPAAPRLLCCCRVPPAGAAAGPPWACREPRRRPPPAGCGSACARGWRGDAPLQYTACPAPAGGSHRCWEPTGTRGAPSGSRCGRCEGSGRRTASPRLCAASRGLDLGKLREDHGKIVIKKEVQF